MRQPNAAAFSLGDNGSVKSWMEISATALKANFRAVHAVAALEAGVPVEVLAVVKANGYGHGAAVAAKILAESGARWLGVTDVEEAMAVRNVVGTDPRVLVMSGIEPSDADQIVAHDLTPVVWTPAHIDALEGAAAGAQKPLRVHVEIDTGMARQGAMPGPELDLLLARLRETSFVQVEGVFSHLATAENAASGENEAQREKFDSALEQVQSAGLKPTLIHLANTSGVDEGSTMRGVAELAGIIDAKVMVRTGLALYGHALPIEHGEGKLVPQLSPVMTWRTHVTGLKNVEAGATVGYGSTFTASGRMKLALLPVGYADGFRREASSGIGDGWVMIAREKAPVVGRVSMNLTVVDVTSISGVSVGDVAVLLGEGVSAEDHAQWCGTIPYDILCGIRAHAIAG